MRKRLITLCAILLILCSASMVAATPITFDIDGGDSSVTISNIRTLGWPSSIDVALASNLDDEIFSLTNGESYSFDFFTIQVDGFLGGGTADISATLAFDQPDEIEITGNGSGWWAVILGKISGGYLTWGDNMPSVMLDSGDYFDVDFEDICLLGNSTTVSATITAHALPVPEPANMVLFGIGLIGLAGFGRKKLFNK